MLLLIYITVNIKTVLL